MPTNRLLSNTFVLVLYVNMNSFISFTVLYHFVLDCSAIFYIWLNQMLLRLFAPQSYLLSDSWKRINFNMQLFELLALFMIWLYVIAWQSSVPWISCRSSHHTAWLYQPASSHQAHPLRAIETSMFSYASCIYETTEPYIGFCVGL